jgi:tRNA pseudouridine38-40 synthase
MRYLATFSYDGTAYNGWQKQPDAATVQGEIERVLSLILNQPIEVYGSGRTDRGVHSHGQTAHFDADKDFDINKLKHGFNRLIKSDIFMTGLKRVKPDFHARYNAKSKFYFFLINNGTYSPFMRDYSQQIRDKLDLESMKKAAESFLGFHNFWDFTTKEEDKDGFVREIRSIKIKQSRGMVRIDVLGNGFMTYMVRFVVGALIAVGQHRESVDYVKEHLDMQTRNVISYKAEAQGLYLYRVNYQ